MQYWKDWEDSILKVFPDISPTDKERMQISTETLEGLGMTGMYIQNSLLYHMYTF